MTAVFGRLFQRRRNPKLFLIGLDCAEPSLVFERFRQYLPNLRGLMESGRYGELESTIPAITVPAWSSMFSGHDPGELGCYGFRNRADYSYAGMTIATSTAIRAPRVWDMAGQAGKQVILVGVPQTFPVRSVNGLLVSCFLTPGTDSPYTWPASLKDEIARTVGSYQFDVPDFRTEDKGHLLQQIYEMTEKRCRLVVHLLKTRPWDLFMFVEIGVDRIHHGMWKYFDPNHPKHEPGNPYESAIRDYYIYLDGQIGQMLELLPEGTTTMVLSDHGAKPMAGGFCFNEWLIREGYLTLAEGPSGIVPLEKCRIDWARTRAWGSGGYYGRLCLNVEGREPQGVVPQREYEATLRELAARLEATTDPAGKPIGTRAFAPGDVYRAVHGIPPDLIVYFGDLAWRSVGSVGYGAVHTFENDTGPDDANHAQYGLYIVNDHQPRDSAQGGRRTWQAVTPTMLQALGLPAPEGMSGARL